jgi:hypothetical protein
MTRRLVRIAFVVAILGSLVAVEGGSGPAHAATATISDIGWWSQTPATPATPAGGFEIAKTSEGDKSVAAVRVAIDGTLTQAILILSETTGGFLAESAVIDACPTVAAWTSVVAGPLAEAPEADCARKVPVTRDATTGSWTVDLLSFIEPGATSVAVVLRPVVVTAVVAPTPPSIPSPVPVPLPVPAVPTAPVPPVTTPVDPGFTIEFSKAEVFAGGPSEVSDRGASSSSSSSGGIASGSTTFAPTFDATDSFASTTDFATLTPTRDVLPSATPTVAASGAGGVGTAASVEAGLQPVAATTGPGAPWGRLLILVPLSFAIGAVGAGVRRTLGGGSVAEATAG